MRTLLGARHHLVNGVLAPVWPIGNDHHAFGLADEPVGRIPQTSRAHYNPYNHALSWADPQPAVARPTVHCRANAAELGIGRIAIALQRSLLAKTLEAARSTSLPFDPAAHTHRSYITSPAPLASAGTSTTSGTALTRNVGTEHQPAASGRTTAVYSTLAAKPSAWISSVKAARPPDTSTSVPVAAARIMEQIAVLKLRSSNAHTPLIASAWIDALDSAKLSSKYPLIGPGLTTGFRIGIPTLSHSYAPFNSPSLFAHGEAFSTIIAHEFECARYLGPFSQLDLESLIGPFQSSPLSLVPKPHKPDRYRLVQNFSHPVNASNRTQSINSFINSDNYPCTWGTFDTFALLVSQLPPGSQAAVRDVAEAYRTIPLHHSQWPGTVVRLSNDPSLFAVDTSAAFGVASNAGVFGHVADAAADIFRSQGIGPISKWVDDHVFIRVRRDQLPAYNETRQSWRRRILAHGGAQHTGGRIWFEGNMLDDGRIEQFDDDMFFLLQDLSALSARNDDDMVFAYNMADIDRISTKLGIPWELSKDVPFGPIFPFTGFLWNLTDMTVALTEAKRIKYLTAIEEWLSRSTHTLEQVQKLHGKLLHTTSVVRKGRAYLSRLEKMLGVFAEAPFAAKHSPRGTDDDLRWWHRILSTSTLLRPIPGPIEVDELLAFSDASSGVGIGIVFGLHWHAWKLVDGWQSDGRDIGWAEAVGFELLVYAVLRHSDSAFQHIRVFGDNQGVVDGWRKGRSRNVQVNEVFKRIDTFLETRGVQVYPEYIRSADNPADGPSRGRFPSSPRLPAIALPVALEGLVIEYPHDDFC